MKWFWMMNYCKNEGLPPAQSWAWNEAEKAYSVMVKNQPFGNSE